MSGTLFWITGLPGAGKTTISRLLFRRLKKKNKRTILLDGDELRSVLGIEGAYSHEERKKLALSYCRLCKILIDQGFDVVIATVSLFTECHEWNRQNLPIYFEIYVSVPLDELKRRNQKNLYDQGATQVVGIDIPFDIPTNPHIVLENTGQLPPLEIANELYNQIKTYATR